MKSDARRNGNGSGTNGPANRARLLPFRKEHRTNTRTIEHGAEALRRAYYSNGLSRRTREGRSITHLERRLAKHCGYESFGQMPVTLELELQLLIGNLIYVATAAPAPDSKTGSRDVHCAQNLIDRILNRIGFTPAQKPVLTLAEYAVKKYGTGPEEQSQ